MTTKLGQGRQFDVNQLVVQKDKPTGVTIANNPFYQEFLRENKVQAANFWNLVEMLERFGDSIQVTEHPRHKGWKQASFYIVHKPTGDYVRGYVNFPNEAMEHINKALGGNTVSKLQQLVRHLEQKGAINTAKQLAQLMQKYWYINN